ncbi:uncharacterized protein LOC115379237 [Myripristis murdjan]|uniref:uncharacterized protein LOC115379237 n=1 Tax=Myripristis murdjan TaxID=586833 RepID=UPI00117614BF|nr:uncharacterized protein LOC115379237 [Myripristis murdjan]
MTLQVQVSLPAARGGSGCSQRGPDAAGYPVNRNLYMIANGGQAAVRQSIHPQSRRFPPIHALGKSGDGKSLLSSLMIGGPNLAKEDRLGSENNDLERDISGRHFLFDKQKDRFERSRTVIPPLPRDYHVHRPGNLHHFRLPKELSHSHAVGPFTLGSRDRYDLNTSPAFLFPSAVVLHGRNTLSVDNCKFNRPKVNYPACNLFTIRDNQKSQSTGSGPSDKEHPTFNLYNCL